MNKFCLLLIATLAGLHTIAQPVLNADKIVAVIGDKIVLKSEIDNSLRDLSRAGQTIPENAQCVMLDQIMGMKALQLQADKDSITVTDEELEAELDLRIRTLEQQYGGKEALEEIAGRSVFQIKEDLRAPTRERKLSETMQRKIVENVRITPNEVKEYFNSLNPDSLIYYETKLEVRQLVVYPKMNPEVEAYLKNKLLELKQKAETGGDFETLARINSDEPIAKESGGVMLMNKITDKGNIDPVFFRTAFTLRVGEVSNVIQTKFGLHIIKLMERTGDVVKVSHILKMPTFLDSDLEKDIKALDTVRNLIIENKMAFKTAVNKFSNDEDTKFTSGIIYRRDEVGELTSKLPIDRFDKELVLMMKNLVIGQPSKVVAFKDERERTGIRFVVIESKKEAHRQNLADDYTDIAAKALEEKKAKLLEAWFIKKIPTYYIKIGDEYKTCGELNKWRTGKEVVTTNY
jgi:peptidyl-prolyl cis-trans isomerase SurA